jgi:hypothetical protein
MPITAIADARGVGIERDADADSTTASPAGSAASRPSGATAPSACASIAPIRSAIR